MTDDELLILARGFVAKWQPRVHLSDWRVEVVVGETEEDGDLGSIRMGHTIRSARITLPADLQTRVDEEAFAHPADPAERVEMVVLHELLHVIEQPYHSRMQGNITHLVGEESLVGIEIRTAYTYYRENWIHQTARALIEADRGAWAG